MSVNVADIGHKPTLSERIAASMAVKKVIPGENYLIVTSIIYKFNKLSKENKQLMQNKIKDISNDIYLKFSPLTIFMNNGVITMVFPSRENGSHIFGGDVLILNGCVSSYLSQLISHIIPDTWIITNSEAAHDKEVSFSYLLLAYRRGKQISKEAYINTFESSELNPVLFNKIAIQLEYIEELIGTGYEEEDHTGYFTKYSKMDNPDSKFGFDRVVKHIKRDISFCTKDIDFIMQEYI